MPDASDMFLSLFFLTSFLTASRVIDTSIIIFVIVHNFLSNKIGEISVGVGTKKHGHRL